MDKQLDPLDIPSFNDFLSNFPTVTITACAIFLGWYLRGRSANQTIEIMKEFINFLKERDK